jgi:N6-L-threonylcarbamoyladenine synthase
MKILGIETSCDETAVAIVDDGKNVLAHTILSQIDIHKAFGGVVPEVAARNHLDVIDRVVEKTLHDAGCKLENVDAICATSGPGLIAGVMVGMMFAKTLASVKKKPFVAVNHLEGHALMPRLIYDIEFPYLLLLASGGHCQILEVSGVGQYKKIGQTIDDSLGEAFDKVAQMLGLEYPGGPKIEKLAKKGDEKRFKFPKPLLPASGRSVEGHDFDFSFSGLKTAVRREIERIVGESFEHGASTKKLSEQDICDICASFQSTVTEIVIDRLENVIGMLRDSGSRLNKLVMSGGVAANQYIKAHIAEVVIKRGYDLYSPPISLCTDNGVMIAWAGLENFRLGKSDGFDFRAKANWELEELSN